MRVTKKRTYVKGQGQGHRKHENQKMFLVKISIGSVPMTHDVAFLRHMTSILNRLISKSVHTLILPVYII